MLTDAGWLWLLILLVGAPLLSARGQKVIVTANASAIGSATVDEPPLGVYKDDVSISASGVIVMKPATNQIGAWVIVSSNYSVSVSGSGSDAASGESWTEIEANPDGGFGLNLSFDTTSSGIPFVGGQALFEITAPWVDVTPSTVTQPQDGLNQAISAWMAFAGTGTLDVPTNNLAFTVSGAGHEDATPLVFPGISETGSFDVSYTVSYQPSDTNLAIISVQTPTQVNGNQNTFISSDSITLRASVGSESAGIPVGWTVLSLNRAAPAVVTSGVAATDSGGISTFTFSPSQNAAFVNFRQAQFTQGTRSPNDPLSFDVVAAAQGQQAKLSQTSLGTLEQDDTDTLRQEYVDYRTLKNNASFTPQRSDVAPSLGGKFNGGNYGVQLSTHLDTSFQAIVQAYQSATIVVDGVTSPMPPNAQITVKSGYRNPQHNKAVGSVYPRTSHHMFGGALDLVPEETWILVNGRRRWLDRDKVLFPALAQAAGTQGAAIAEIGPATKVPVGTTGEDHIHVEW